MTPNFLRGFVDGTLSTLGVIIGASAAATPIIIAAGIGGALANGISNLLSAFSAEELARYRELRQVEKAMVDKELKGSFLDRSIWRKTFGAGARDGLATILGGAPPILPFVFLPVFPALLVAIGVGIVAVVMVGVYLGRLSRRSLVYSGARMALFAIVVAGLVYIIQTLIVPD